MQKKKAEKKTKTIYYSDLLNDDFMGTHIKTKVVDENFKFVHKNIIWRFFSFLIYYLVAVPVIWFYTTFILGLKLVNKKSIKKLKGKNCFFYGNHTGICDAFSTNLASLPTRNKLIVGPDTVSIKCLKNFTQMLGALPIPDNFSGMKKFVQAVEYYHNKHYNITIYPEAHIWPYYTGIRPFKDNSFGYPISLSSPVIAFCTTYQKPKGIFAKLRKANITVYFSDPIYPDLTKPKKQAQKELRDKVYDFMVETSKKYSTFDYIIYKPIEEKPVDEESVEEQTQGKSSQNSTRADDIQVEKTQKSTKNNKKTVENTQNSANIDEVAGGTKESGSEKVDTKSGLEKSGAEKK